MARRAENVGFRSTQARPVSTSTSNAFCRAAKSMRRRAISRFNPPREK
ncbi:hypothetical protein [Archangium gephyra]